MKKALALAIVGLCLLIAVCLIILLQDRDEKRLFCEWHLSDHDHYWRRNVVIDPNRHFILYDRDENLLFIVHTPCDAFSVEATADHATVRCTGKAEGEWIVPRERNVLRVAQMSGSSRRLPIPDSFVQRLLPPRVTRIDRDCLEFVGELYHKEVGSSLPDTSRNPDSGPSL